MKFCSNCGTPIDKKLPVKCVKCAAEFWRNPRCCAGALTLDNNKVLLVRRLAPPWDGYWDIPGGYCEWNEHPKQCAKRETFEEAGLNIQINDFHGIWLEPATDESNGDNICIYYTAEIVGNSIATPDGIEVDKVEWFDLNELPEKIAFPDHIPDVLKMMKLRDL